MPPFLEVPPSNVGCQTFHCSWINPEVCGFLTHGCSGNGKSECRQVPSLLRLPAPTHRRVTQQRHSGPHNQQVLMKHLLCAKRRESLGSREPGQQRKAPHPRPSMTAELSPQGPTWLPCGHSAQATRLTPAIQSPVGIPAAGRDGEDTVSTPTAK